MNRLDRNGVPYLSHSKVATLERCPRCYYNQYILGEQLDTTPVAVGSFFHKAAKAFYQALASDAALPNTGKMMKGLALRRLDKESKAKLRNALTTLRNNQWKGYSVICLEDPFFMDLCHGLPPIIGVPDLVLSQNRAFVVVDHKTAKTFKELDSAQLVLYAEHIRRDHATNAIVGAFDEYRLVPDLSKIKKPVFRRTPVSVDRSFLPALIQRYRKAWKRIARMSRSRKPAPSPDCWQCNSYGFWR
jgi:RecB family exonuclease